MSSSQTTETPQAETNNTGRMDKHIVRAMAWTGAAKWGTQILTWASTIIVARLLLPSDYGLIGMATVYLGLVALISEFGLGQAVITLRNLNNDQVSQLNTLSVVFGFLLFGLSCTVAYPIGKFFAAPKLPNVIMVMSLGFVMTGLQVIPEALLQRDLRFKLLASIDGVKALGTAIGTVTFAALGFGYWSLALGGLLTPLIGATLVLIARRQSFCRPAIKKIQEAISFSRNVLISRVAWYSYSNSDFLVAGRVFGQAPLGNYTLAWTIASTPVEKITNMVTRVTPAFFSAVQKEPAELRRYLTGITEMLALVTFPVSIGLALVADQFVYVVLGPKWAGAVTSLQLLGIYAAMRSITTLLPSILNATGNSLFQMWNTIAAAIIFPLAFLFSSRWGTTGIAATWIVLYPLITLPIYYRTFKQIEMSTSQYLRSILPALQSSLIMAVIVILVRKTIPATLPTALQLTITVLAGALSYGLALWITNRNRLIQVIRRLRS